jgi:transglutaminase-like putative cysteine protease
MTKKASPWWDFSSLLLLFFLFLIAVARLLVTNWIDELYRAALLAFLGFVFGTLLGKSAFNRRTSAVFAIVYSLFFVIWQLSLVVPETAEWSERLSILYARLYWTTADVLSNKAVSDPILFLAAMSAFFWGAALAGSFNLIRSGNPWVVVILMGIVLLNIDYYHAFLAEGALYTGAYVLVSLLLIGRLFYIRTGHFWEATGIQVDVETGHDLGRGVLIGGLVLVLLAWSLPGIFSSLEWRTPDQLKAIQSWERLRSRLGNAFAGLRNPVIQVNAFFGDEMSLGSGTILGDEILFTVAPDKFPANLRFYWRARSYDSYQGYQWKNTITSKYMVQAGEWPFNYEEYQSREEIHLSFTSKVPTLVTIYSEGLPVSVSRQVKVAAQKLEDGNSDVVSVQADPPMREGETFSVTSYAAVPTAFQLRGAAQDYPQWVKDRYLRLPEKFSPKIRKLAEDLTTNERTAFDKTAQITRYLRQTISYQETIENPPSDRDPIEWFLFDYKKGFCNYYATAEVLMLRSIGIPARLAVGFAQGNPGQDGHSYEVRRRDSHAWPEVYFTGYGWVEFEPTSGLPVYDLPAGEETESGNDLANQINPFGLGEKRAEDLLNEEAGGGAAGKPGTASPVRWILPVVLLLAVVGSYFFLKSRQRQGYTLDPFPVLVERFFMWRGWVVPGWLHRWANRSRFTPMQKVFANLPRMSRWLGVKISAMQTPTEQVSALVEVLPEVSEPAQLLLREYQFAEYSPYPAKINQAQRAARRMWKLVFSAVVKRQLGL